MATQCGGDTLWGDPMWGQHVVGRPEAWCDTLRGRPEGRPARYSSTPTNTGSGFRVMPYSEATRVRT